MPISSTNRSDARNAHISDYYVTPVKDIVLFLESFKETVVLDWPNLKVLDPCAGGSAQEDMSYPFALMDCCNVKNIKTIDIRDDSRAEIKTDYLTHRIQTKPDMIITNPPFNIAEQVIRKALADVQDGGWVIMLLRLNFFGSKQRKPLWGEYMPRYAFVHHKRIGFTQGGKTDSIEYMHCCWQKGINPKFCELKII